MEKTFVMIKPDGVQRKLVGKIISRFEKKGLKIAAIKFMLISQELAETHYAEHKGKGFFKPLLNFITSGPVVAMVLTGDGAVKTVREMMGKTNPQEAAPGTLRGDYALSTEKNLVHGSDSPESAQREITLFFKDEEVLEYGIDLDKWVYE